MFDNPATQQNLLHLIEREPVVLPFPVAMTGIAVVLRHDTLLDPFQGQHGVNLVR
jgi:hypothetical protein